MTDLTRDILHALGFVDLAVWQRSGEHINYRLDGERASANELLLDEPNALYAFVRGDAVQYIGKTGRSVKKRFTGYRKPGNRSADKPTM